MVNSSGDSIPFPGNIEHDVHYSLLAKHLALECTGKCVLVRVSNAVMKQCDKGTSGEETVSS